MKQFGTFDEKDNATKKVLAFITVDYLLQNGIMEDVLKKLDNAYISEDEIKEYDERICYYGDKISLATKLLAMNRLYNEKRYDDILKIINYIKEQQNKLEIAVKEEM